MAAPTWVTPAGDLLRPITTTTATGSVGGTTLVVASSTGIEFGQLISGVGVNPGTTVAYINGTTVGITTTLQSTPAGTYTFSTPLFLENTSINVEFVSTASNSNNTVTYTLLNGSYPVGNLALLSTANVAYLTGSLSNIAANTTSEFTLRANEIKNEVVVGIADRTFTMTVVDNTQPQFTSRAGVLTNQQTLGAGAVETAAPISNVYLSNLATGGNIQFTSGNSSIRGNVTLLTVDTRVQVVGATAGYNISNSTIYWIHSLTANVSNTANSVFSLKANSLANAAALVPDFTGNLTLEVANVVTVATAPADIAAYNLSNANLIYFGGIGGATSLNGNPFYLGNANAVADTFNVYLNGTLTRPLTKIDNLDLGTYIPNTGTVTAATPDCVYFTSQLTANLGDPGVTGVYSIVSGNLPQGLELSPTGLISGYPRPPLSPNDQPTYALNTFTVGLDTGSGNTTQQFSIPVVNQQWAWSANNVGAWPGRPPSILNNAPLQQYVSTADPYYSYYFSGNSIGVLQEDNVLLFKFIGYNWNSSQSQGANTGMTYTITGLTAGPNPNVNAFSTGNLISPDNANSNIAENGWINGTLANLSASSVDIKNYNFTVTASNISQVDGVTVLTSPPLNLSMTITGLVSTKVTWVTDADLGTIVTGQISSFRVQALFDPLVTDVLYVVSSGALPPNLVLLPNGEITGRVALQPGTTLESLGTRTTYTFTVEAYSRLYQSEGVTSQRTFTITTVQETSNPWDDLYMVALLPSQQQTTIDQLLGSIRSTQAANIYRLTDPNFSVSTGVKYAHMYGVSSKNTDEFYSAYVEAVKRNHYYKNLTLGPLETARALDSKNQVVYEVIYSPIVDNQVNSSGVSISKSILWPYPIYVEDQPVNRELFPNSLINMRQQIETSINTVNSGPVLPLWMTSLQTNGVLPGYVPCWVLCYCKPGTATAVKTYIEGLLSAAGTQLNNINFEIDRFEVDRSLTYTWGSVETYAWPTLTAEFYNGNSTVILNSTEGLTINQPIKFSPLVGPVDLGAGTITAATNSPTITGVGTAFTAPALVNKRLYNSEFQLIGNVQSVTNSTTLTLYNNAAIVVNSAPFYVESTGTINIAANTTYWITELRPNYLANNVITNSIKIRPSYYGNATNVITPNSTAKMAVITQPLSASVADDSKNSYVYFDQQTIVRV